MRQTMVESSKIPSFLENAQQIQKSNTNEAIIMNNRPPLPFALKKSSTRIYEGYIRNMRKIPSSNSKKKISNTKVYIVFMHRQFYFVEALSQGGLALGN